MRKTLLLIVSLFSIQSYAQIMITPADLATPIKVIYQAVDTIPKPLSFVGSAGASQTWNMTALDSVFVDTLTFLNYGAAPNPKFSTSNLIAQQNISGGYGYFKTSADSVIMLGNSITADLGNGPVTINQVNSPGEKLLNFPTTYTSSFTNVYYTKSKFYLGQTIGGFNVDTIRQHSRTVKTVSVDAWGSLTTPLGTFSVLRLKETKITRDTVDAYVGFFWINGIQKTADSTTKYIWWANNIGFPLVTATTDSSGMVSYVEWLKSFPVTGINELAGTALRVYPNPAQNVIHISTDKTKASSIQISDITGRVVDIYAITADVTTINISAYADGLYNYIVTGAENRLMSRGKFTVVK